MLLADVVTTSAAVAATRERGAKVAALAERVRAAEPPEIALAARYLAGERRQPRLDVGWASLAGPRAAAGQPSLTLADVDTTLERIATAAGPGSRGRKQEALDDLMRRATADEQRFLRGIILGELRQGALAGLLVQAIAAAAEVSQSAVRRALMLDPDIGEVARLALTEGCAGLAGVALTLFRPVQPMLASTAAAVATALEDLGPGDVAVEWKLDGTRVQVHRRGAEVRAFSRGLRDVTDRSRAAVAAVEDLRVSEIVLDGELLGVGPDGRPTLFQDTMSGRSDGAGRGGSDEPRARRLRPWFFDVLYLDGEDLLDAPAHDRAAVLAEVVPEALRVPRAVVTDAGAGEAVLEAALAAGHEGVVVKSLDAPYAAGRRGGAWRKVKPVHTLDLVVLAVEWGSGRREGWLSNLHLGARADDGSGFVMLGKTFKGLTDELLAWQTERFLALETGRRGHVVEVAPEQVVEIAVDGVQRSSRYPGGVALRFARVVRYRDDKTAAQSDTLDTVRRLFTA